MTKLVYTELFFKLISCQVWHAIHPTIEIGIVSELRQIDELKRSTTDIIPSSFPQAPWARDLLTLSQIQNIIYNPKWRKMRSHKSIHFDIITHGTMLSLPTALCTLECINYEGVMAWKLMNCVADWVPFNVRTACRRWRAAGCFIPNCEWKSTNGAFLHAAYFTLSIHIDALDVRICFMESILFALAIYLQRRRNLMSMPNTFEQCFQFPKWTLWKIAFITLFSLISHYSLLNQWLSER